MLIAYPVLIKRDYSGRITNLHFPDLAYEYQLSDEDEEPKDLQVYLSQVLLTHLTFLKGQNNEVPRPKKLKDYKNKAINSNAIWTKAYVDFDFKEGIFEKVLPRFGLFSSIMTAATMALLSFSAMEISSDSGVGVGFGIFGAVCTSLMAVAVYYYSNTGNVSRQLGKRADDAIRSIASCENFNQNPLTTLNLSRHSTAAMLGRLLITAVPVTSATVSSIAHYQQVKSMGARIGGEQIITREIFYTTNNIMIIFGFYSLMTFQMSFLPPIYQVFDRLIDKWKNSRDIELEEIEHEHINTNLLDASHIDETNTVLEGGDSVNNNNNVDSYSL